MQYTKQRDTTTHLMTAILPVLRWVHQDVQMMTSPAMAEIVDSFIIGFDS